MAETQRDLDLVRLYWPVELRPAFDALFAIETTLAEIVATSTQPTLGMIRLAWWREALERLDSQAAPAEPRLQAVAEHILPHGISGTLLARMEDGFSALLDEDIDGERVANYGAILFQAGADILGAASGPDVEMAGRIYALSKAARGGLMAIPEDASGHIDFRHRFPKSLRPLTGLAALSARDIRRAPMLESEASPARAFALLRHRFTGRL